MQYYNVYVGLMPQKSIILRTDNKIKDHFVEKGRRIRQNLCLSIVDRFIRFFRIKFHSRFFCHCRHWYACAYFIHFNNISDYHRHSSFITFYEKINLALKTESSIVKTNKYSFPLRETRRYLFLTACLTLQNNIYFILCTDEACQKHII